MASRWRAVFRVNAGAKYVDFALHLSSAHLDYERESFETFAVYADLEHALKRKEKAIRHALKGLEGIEITDFEISRWGCCTSSGVMGDPFSTTRPRDSRSPSGTRTTRMPSWRLCSKSSRSATSARVR